jgi:hypothetical protein
MIISAVRSPYPSEQVHVGSMEDSPAVSCHHCLFASVKGQIPVSSSFDSVDRRIMNGSLGVEISSQSRENAILPVIQTGLHRCVRVHSPR